MPGTPITVFISYSRRDSNFVDRLEAGLKASNFRTWVDRRDVEISQSWKKVLQDVIERCDIALIVLSPASVTSPYVQMEYKYALGIGKHIILLEYQTCSTIPDDLLGIQKVDFRTNSRDRMRNLLIALIRIEIEPPSRLEQPTDVEQAALQSIDATSVVTQSVSASTKPDLETIYNMGVVAKEQKNFDLATALWQEIHIRDPHFHNSSLANEYGKMLRELRSYHVTYFRTHALLMQNARKWRQAAGFWQDLLAEKPQDSQARRSLERCLRIQGEEASASGEWEQAISMWETLLKLKPGDAQATRQLALAKNNLNYTQYYEDAQQFIADDAPSPARAQLHQLWQNAPYYGDPKELALKAGMTAQFRSPATFDKEEEERLVKEQKEREAQKARELERQAQEQQLLDMLKIHDVEAWSQWRHEHQKQQPDLSGADLHGLDLREFDVRGAILANANLRDTNLQGANLSEAVLEHADLSEAKLNEAILPDADLSNATLVKTEFRGADLRKAKLIRANMTDADLSEAFLQDVDLTQAVSKETDLTQADLTEATLTGTNLSGAILKKANFDRVYLSQTIFKNVDLRETKGLETVVHFEPSAIDIDTIDRSRSNIPIEFLRQAGTPDIIIDSMFASADHPMKYPTCFISYSSKDEVFAKMLYSDLLRLGVRCDFAPESLRISDPFKKRIAEYIQNDDKLLLIFSEHSLESPWVKEEAKIATQKEDQLHQSVLFPFKIDNAVLTTDQDWAEKIRDKNHIGDFISWQQPGAYLVALAHLLRDLKNGS